MERSEKPQQKQLKSGWIETSEKRKEQGEYNKL
jgi:hypothetical protein